MDKEITIENLQQEVAELKTKVEAREAEIENLNKLYEEEKGLHKLYDGLYFEKTQKVTQLTEFLRSVVLMAEAAMEEEMDRASSARLELIVNTIKRHQNESQKIA